MPRVVYEAADGTRTELAAVAGTTVRDLALSGGVEGIIGECGGEAMCASCHVYVDQRFLERLEPIREDEDEMLESTASERRANSRLSCQIALTEQLDGLVVRMPDEQL
jgi:ferredoxin, 2Fe-2S